MDKDSVEAFEQRCRQWFEELETVEFIDPQTRQPIGLSSYLSCEAFEARFDPNWSKALSMGANAVSFLARIMDEMRSISSSTANPTKPNPSPTDPT